MELSTNLGGSKHTDPNDVSQKISTCEKETFTKSMSPPMTNTTNSSFISSKQTSVTNHIQNRPENVNISTPQLRIPDSNFSTPQAASYVSGEVMLTPTNRSFTPQAHSANPHNSMTVLTPMSSAVSQAKNSIKIQNCISTVNLGCDLKLVDIYCRTRFSEYNPSRFHGVVMKILDPRTTALVFKSGKIVCTGAKNENDAYIGARKFVRIIQKLGYPVKFLDFKVQNFIATADLRFPLRLEALQQAHGQFTSYEPELFSGLVYRMVRPRVVLLIFVNGKLVITGGKTRNEIYEAVDIIHPILRSFKKN